MSSPLVDPAPVALAAAIAAPERGGWRGHLRLTRPRLGMLGLITVLLSAFLAQSRSDSLLSAMGWLALALGSALCLAGASALNQCLELRQDALMVRTSRRPLPSGELSLASALAFGLLMSGGGLLILLAGVNAATTGWALAGIASYVLVYTPVKRHSHLNTLIGALPGALPILMGWSAAGPLSLDAWILFGLLFLWQVPHFLAIAWLYRQDYERASFRMLGFADPAGDAMGRQALLYSAALGVIPFLLIERSFAGWLFGVGALILGAWFFQASRRFDRHRSPRDARRLLRASVTYLPLILLTLVVDRLLTAATGG